ncbi:MAG TPA: tetratricopeptide repeat protein [Thermoflexus sp.]|nr:tetratricopeptide repeat protein [Thermoflexus sp.]
MSHEAIAKAIDALLDVLGALGVPGTPIARRAVQGVESLRRSQEARRRLEERLQEAEADFREQAAREGLGAFADWVGSLPVHDLLTFRQALERLRERWDEQALAERLAEEFARIPNVREADRARALALYMTCLRVRLVADEHFRPVIVALSALRTEERVEKLQETVADLYRAVNTLLGLPEDLVVWPVQPPPEHVPELRPYLLHPKYRLVPYTGRAFGEMLKGLLAWARGLEDAQPPVGLRTYIGRGGAGKTRLLIEAGEALRQEGWWVGFLRAGRLTPQNAALLVTDARPTLLIVDYIADRSEEVRPLLREAARVARERSAPLAIVLLERTFPQWLEKDLRSFSDPEYVGWPEFLSLPTVERDPRPLPTLEAGEGADLFEQALERFLHLLSSQQRPSFRYSELPEAPLYILLLAMLATEGIRVDRPADPARILEYAWGRERDAWKRHLRPLFAHQPEERLERALEVVEDLAVVATLGRTFPNRRALTSFLQAHLEPIPGVSWGELADRIPSLFPRAERSLVPPITPDPLADFVLRRRLAERSDLISWALATAEEAQAEPEEAIRAAMQALGVLARLWEAALGDRPEQERMEGLMREAARHLAIWPSPVVEVIARLLPPPDRTLALRSFLADFYRAGLERIPKEEVVERAWLLNNLGVALSELGRREEALAPTQEAVDLYRQLAATHPQAFLPDLARSLNNLGVMLSELGRPEKALKATQEAVVICRQLVAAYPQAFLPDLAMSLNNLGAILSELGQQEKALAATQEAVEIYHQLYRQLAATNPQAFRPYLAGSLHNLGARLSELGWREEALKATQEAVDLYRQLAATHPQAFLPNLARSLGMHGVVLLSLGRAQEARAALGEGLRVIRPFAQALPDAFGGLAAALWKDYLKACQEAGEEPETELVVEYVFMGHAIGLALSLLRLAPLLLALVGVARGEADPEVAQAVEGALAQMREHLDWRALAEALGRLLAGEREPAALRQGLALDAVDEQALLLVERAVADERALALLVALARAAAEGASQEDPSSSASGRSDLPPTD